MMKMRYLLPLPLLLLAILPACVAPPPPPPVEEVVTVKPTHYWVVPMESPTLGFAGRSADAGLAVPVALTTEGGWSPGDWFATEVERQVQLSGVAVSRSSVAVTVVADPVGGIGLSGETWLKPVRAWYDSPEPAMDYLSTGPQYITRVLEVGIANYSIEDLNLYLSVLIKVVDVETGQVLRRARVFSTTDVRPEDAFPHEARLFKETFSKTGQQLVGKCLEQLGPLN